MNVVIVHGIRSNICIWGMAAQLHSYIFEYKFKYSEKLHELARLVRLVLKEKEYVALAEWADLIEQHIVPLPC